MPRDRISRYKGELEGVVDIKFNVITEKLRLDSPQGEALQQAVSAE
ncbi:hypothetical protein GNP80_13910 [Aliivibrio fischeri]|nr:hypothetical protein [Aliivibrio fischeri]MUK93527.1 hypothetical protein [Aliivibrio fischeri]